MSTALLTASNLNAANLITGRDNLDTLWIAQLPKNTRNAGKSKMVFDLTTDKLDHDVSSGNSAARVDLRGYT